MIAVAYNKTAFPAIHARCWISAFILSRLHVRHLAAQDLAAALDTEIPKRSRSLLLESRLKSTHQ
jgi:hypothetical protein